MNENALLLHEILRHVLVDSGLHWFEVWRLRAVCRAFHRLSKAVLPEVMIKNSPLLHVHSTSEFDDNNVYLKPVKWDPEAETLLFLPAAIDVRSHDPTCSKCLAVKKPSKQPYSEDLFEDQPGSEQQHEATIVGRRHGDLGSAGRIRFEGWNKVWFTHWDPIDSDPMDDLRHAWIKAKDEQGGTLDTRKPCVYRDSDSDQDRHPAIRMVYSVVELDEYNTTGDFGSGDTEFYYTVEYKILEALVSFPWVLHGFVSSYVPPPTFFAKRLRSLAAICNIANERGLLPLRETEAFFGDIRGKRNRKAFVAKRNDCFARPADLIVQGNGAPFNTIAEILEDDSLSDLDAEEEVYEYLGMRYLRPKGLKFVDDQIVSIGLPRVNRKRSEQRSLYLLSGVPGGSSQLETLFELPRVRAALLSCIRKPGSLLRTSKYMWKVGMSIGLVDWVHAWFRDTDLVDKAIKWAKWELSSEKTYSYEGETLSEEYIVLLAHFILTPGAIAELVRREIAARKAGLSDQARSLISWELFRFCLESKLDDMNTLLGLGIQAISAYCWEFDPWDSRKIIFWNTLVKSGTAHVKTLLTDARNEFKPHAWRTSLNSRGIDAIYQRLESSDAETSWRVLVDLDLLDWEARGKEYLTLAIRLQVNVCIDDLLDKGIVSVEALSEIFTPPDFRRETQQRDNPDMALFKRLVNNPLLYTDQAWAAAVTVLLRPPLDSGREALELLVHRPLLAAPTPELIMSLASFGETHPEHPASAIFPQIIQLVGKEKVRNLALEFWEHESTAKIQETQKMCFKRLIEGTIFLYKSFGINAFEKTRFLTIAALYWNVVMPRGGVGSTEEVDWIERGTFHDVDEHGHSEFAETLLSGMGQRYAPPPSDSLTSQLFHYFLKILATHRIRIKDRSAFLSVLLLLEQSHVNNHGPNILKLLFHQPHEASAASSSDVTLYRNDISMMSHTGQYDIPLTPSLLVAACITSSQSFLRVILDSGIRFPDRYSCVRNEEEILKFHPEISRGLAWITEALNFWITARTSIVSVNLVMSLL
ncbi:hypothetical protein HDU86_001910 [Geranomyces michiganensis]|nr:hypothetical protein HDU86_001910 [Geranomyces michiganensis]